MDNCATYTRQPIIMRRCWTINDEFASLLGILILYVALLHACMCACAYLENTDERRKSRTLLQISSTTCTTCISARKIIAHAFLSQLRATHGVQLEAPVASALVSCVPWTNQLTYAVPLYMCSTTVDMLLAVNGMQLQALFS